jgi:S-formylglutathione hydrolase FrmB
MHRLGGLVGLVALVGGLVLGAPARAAEEDPPYDNGAQGKTDSLNEGDVPPIEACNTQPEDKDDSRIERPIVDGPEELSEDGDADSLAFTTGLCVYLPADYKAHGGPAYPVLYLLHGGGGDAADWVNFGDLQATADATSRGVIVVMPDGSNGVWYDHPNGSVRNETYVIDHVIPYVDEHYNTIGSRRGRVVAGLSNGGLGALVLAAKHPDLFAAASSMSGNLGGYAHEYDQLNRPAYHDGNTPTPLASNLLDVAVIQEWGGQPCVGDAAVDLCASWAFEQLFRLDNTLFDRALTDLGHPDHVYRDSEGSHAWRWWTPWLRDTHLPFLLDRLAAATDATPATWQYKSISGQFTVWGYDITVEREAEEMLELTDVTTSSMTLTGSGVVTVRTPVGGVHVVDLGDGETKTIPT